MCNVADDDRWPITTTAPAGSCSCLRYVTRAFYRRELFSGISKKQTTVLKRTLIGQNAIIIVLPCRFTKPDAGIARSSSSSCLESTRRRLIIIYTSRRRRRSSSYTYVNAIPPCHDVVSLHVGSVWRYDVIVGPTPFGVYPHVLLVYYGFPVFYPFRFRTACTAHRGRPMT